MNSSPSQVLTGREAWRFWLLTGIVGLVVMSVTLFLFSVAYMDDLGTLRNAPEIVWNFVCGRPTDNAITLPLLLTMSIVCALGGAGLFGWRWWLGRSRAS